MSKKVIAVSNANNEGAIETVVTENNAGRKIDMSSKRQQDLLAKELRRQQGLLKKGRPVNGESNRQVRLAELNDKRANGLLKLGRPAYSEAEKIEADKNKATRKEEEAAKIKEMAAMILAGEVEAPAEVADLIPAKVEATEQA